MKKLLLTAAFFLTAIIFSEVKAQTTASTTLTVNLTAVQSIQVNQATVAINFGSSTDYLNGVNAPQTDHITFSSTAGYAITALAATDLTGGDGGSIPISTINITPTQGTKTSNGLLSATKPLSLTVPALIYSTASTPTGSGGTTQAKLSVNYKASGGSDYLNRTGAFSSIITYTIAPL
jgi:hypothetical protein